jgi:hypothetical protein
MTSLVTAVVDPDPDCEPRFGLGLDTLRSVDLDPDPKPEELSILTEEIEATDPDPAF